MARKFVKGPMIRPAGRRGPLQGKGKAKSPSLDRDSIADEVRFPETIPAGMAGTYAVWSPDGLRIVGSGSTLEEALAIATLEDGRLVQRIPGAIRARSLGGTEPIPIEG